MACGRLSPSPHEEVVVVADGAADLLDPDDPAWERALDEVRHDAYHRPGYVALQAGGHGEPLAFRYREGGRTMLVPLVVRPVEGSDAVDATSPYGYPGPVSNASLDDEGFWHRACTALVASLTDRGAVTCFVRLHPLLPVRLDVLGRSGRLVQHGHTVSVDLTRTEEEMWSATRKRDRSYVRRAREDGVDVVVDDFSTLGAVAGAYAETMDRLGAAAGYRSSEADFEELRRAVGDDLHLATVVRGGQVLGGVFLLERCGIVQLHLRGTRTAALDLQVDKVEVDAVRRWAKARGASVLHLGGGLGGREDSLFRFKSGFSKDRRPFFTWHLVLDRAREESLVAQRGGGGDGFFPAYRGPGSSLV